MSTSHDGPPPNRGPFDPEDPFDRSRSREYEPTALRLAVVHYEGKPNRGTIHPAGLRGIERMETWLSADVSAFIPLSLCR